MYGLAGFMLGAKAGGASVQLGYGYEMEAIAACTIGGVSVTGGRGKVSSAVIYPLFPPFCALPDTNRPFVNE